MSCRQGLGLDNSTFEMDTICFYRCIYSFFSFVLFRTGKDDSCLKPFDPRCKFEMPSIEPGRTAAGNIFGMLHLVEGPMR